MNLKESFFARKNILLVITCVFVAYILIWAGVLFNNKLNHVHAAHALKVQQEKIQKLPKEQQATMKAEKYLISSIQRLQPFERMFLDYLQRKFDLNEKLGVVGSPFGVSEDPRIYPQDTNYLYRIAYPDKVVEILPKDALDGPTLTNVFSANCDHLPLPANYWQAMEENYAAGGYYLTHVALALALMKDNGCNIPAQESDLPTRVITGMLAIAEDSKSAPDLRYEAIAFIQFNGRYDLIKPEWLEKIASEQNADGSWGKGAQDKDTGHTTILAMWALLEYSKPGVPYEPLIHHPTDGG